MPLRRAAALVVSVACVLAATAATARAQLGQPAPVAPPTTASTTSTTAAPDPPASSTTTTVRSTTTTTAPAPERDEVPPLVPDGPADPSTDGDASPNGSAPGASAPPPEGEGGDGEAPSGAGPFPAELKAMMDSVKRTGSNNTRRLVAALQPLVDLGVPAEEIVRVGYGRFPVGGHATYSHDWWFPRFGPGWRLHQGTDIFAPYGTPVRAPANGVVRLTNGGLGGLSTYLYQPDGTYFYMTHLSAHPAGLVDGQAVKVGDVVGYVGTSGNARGTPPHLHFEIHPAPREVVTVRGERKVVVRPVPIGTRLPAIDPKRHLDHFIEEALAHVPNLIAHYGANRPRALVATGLTRRFSGARTSVFAAPSRPPQTDLLWASSANPTGGALAIAESEAAEAVQRMRRREPAPSPISP